MQLLQIIVAFLLFLFVNGFSSCKLLSHFYMPSLFKQGDIMIGGIFPVFNKEDIFSPSSFKSEPARVKCTG